MLGAILSWVRDLFIRKFPKHPARITIVLVLIALFCLGIRSYLIGWRVSFAIQKDQYAFFVKRITLSASDSEKSADSMAPNTPPVEQLPKNCPSGYICSGFKTDDFSGWNEYFRSPKNPNSIIVSSESLWDNPPLLFRKDSFNLNFTAILYAIPKNQAKGNIVFLYKDVWRCIIGETNYNTITCESNYNSKKVKRYQQFLSIQNKPPIQPNKEIKITITSKVNAEQKNDVSLSLEYVDTLGNSTSTAFTYQFDLPAADTNNFTSLIGVGIIDPNQEKIEVEFEQLSAHKDL